MCSKRLEFQATAYFYKIANYYGSQNQGCESLVQRLLITRSCMTHRLCTRLYKYIYLVAGRFVNAIVTQPQPPNHERSIGAQKTRLVITSEVVLGGPLDAEGEGRRLSASMQSVPGAWPSIQCRKACLVVHGY